LLQALGVEILDADGNPLSLVARLVDATRLDQSVCTPRRSGRGSSWPAM
jgi:hypothetical protein